ncbi:MAG: hypothetical protein HY963_07905, partial [Ignavibacteriales bacterium]|nr:hypothetical protein [Ignavibacteriales bacterium]
SLIFGKDSAYGQLGNRAPQGLSAIERLGAGGSNAEDAWLYRAYGGGDLNKFYERKREGIYSLENFNAIASQLNRDFGGNEWMIERRLNTMPQFSDFKTAGIIPKLAQSIAEHPYGYTQEDFKKIKNDPDFKERNMGDYQKDAAGAVSATEKNRAEQQTIMNQIGDDYRKMINKMGLDWLSTWRDLSTSANNYKIIQDQLNDVLGESIKRFKEFFVEGGKSAKEFEEWKKREELESNRFQPKKEETEDDQTTKKSLQQLDNKFKLQHSPSYDEWKNKHTPIKDAHGIPAEGFVAEEMSKLQKALSESPLGMRYRTSLYEGDATTGHAPGSPHYTGKAFDTSLYDKVANKKIDADNYPPEVKTFYQQFADEHGLKYGGSFKRSFRDGKFIAGPDNNHFQEGIGSPVNEDESHSEFNRIKSVVGRDKEYQKEYQEDTRKQLLMRSEYEKYGISILPSYRISGNELSPKSMSEGFKKALQYRNEPYWPISESAIDYKRKDQSFFEPSSKIKNEKNEGNFNFDPNAIKEAILQGFRELSGRGNDQKEIIIRDKTANGITSEHMETSRRNANSFYNGR